MDAPAVNPGPPRNSPSLALSPPFGTHRCAADTPPPRAATPRRARRATQPAKTLTREHPSVLKHSLAHFCSLPLPFRSERREEPPHAITRLSEQSPKPRSTIPRFLPPRAPPDAHESILPLPRASAPLLQVADESSLRRRPVYVDSLPQRLPSMRHSIVSTLPLPSCSPALQYVFPCTVAPFPRSSEAFPAIVSR